tara:strand:+ start:345 stop:602 length:258 start_codon:yes stop_codon:yes gene_type:complete
MGNETFDKKIVVIPVYRERLTPLRTGFYLCMDHKTLLFLAHPSNLSYVELLVSFLFRFQGCNYIMLLIFILFYTLEDLKWGKSQI